MWDRLLPKKFLDNNIIISTLKNQEFSTRVETIEDRKKVLKQAGVYSARHY